MHSSPLEKHENTTGIPALVGHTSVTFSPLMSRFLILVHHSVDEGLKGTAFLTDNLVDEKTAFSQEVNASSLTRAFNTKLDVWKWLELPENVKRHRRFGKGMDGMTKLSPPEQAVGGLCYFISWE
jgi:hypothetical protein